MSETNMTNLLEQAINCDDGERAAKIIQDALGIESDDVANYCLPKEWPMDRERSAAVIGEGSKRKRSSWLNAARAGALPAANGNCVTAITSRDRGCEYFSLSQDWAAIISAALKRQTNEIKHAYVVELSVPTDWTSN